MRACRRARIHNIHSVRVCACEYVCVCVCLCTCPGLVAVVARRNKPKSGALYCCRGIPIGGRNYKRTVWTARAHTTAADLCVMMLWNLSTTGRTRWSAQDLLRNAFPPRARIIRHTIIIPFIHVFVFYYIPYYNPVRRSISILRVSY